MLKYTGNPLVDVGAATIAAFVKRHDPSQVTKEEKDEIANYIAYEYTKNPLKGFLQGAIFMNSGYVNPGIKREEDRIKSFGPTLFAYQKEANFQLPPCAICGLPSFLRVFRDYFPLLTGRDIINFYPDGYSGFPICGDCLLSIQSYPLGSAGLLVIVHSDNQRIVFHFAKSFLEDNRKRISLSRETGDKEALRPGRTTKTLIINTLFLAEEMQADERGDGNPFSISAYYLSNSGQNPSVKIFHLPSELILFLRKMNSADFKNDWENIIKNAWDLPPKKQVGNKEFIPKRNYLYEDLFDLYNNGFLSYENSSIFIRTYILRVAFRSMKKNPNDPRHKYSTKSDVGIVSWKITQEFLRRIMHMEQERINQIRDMGDRLAEYVSSQNDKRFFQEFFVQNRYDYLRSRLLKANLAHVKRGNMPIIEFEPYIQVFEEGTELARSDWRLARDLVLIRMVERLHTLNWFGKNPDALTDELLQPEEENQ